MSTDRLYKILSKLMGETTNDFTIYTIGGEEITREIIEDVGGDYVQLKHPMVWNLEKHTWSDELPFDDILNVECELDAKACPAQLVYEKKDPLFDVIKSTLGYKLHTEEIWMLVNAIRKSK